MALSFSPFLKQGTSFSFFLVYAVIALVAGAAIVMWANASRDDRSAELSIALLLASVAGLAAPAAAATAILERSRRAAKVHFLPPLMIRSESQYV